MTREQKKVRVAQDVLALVEAGLIRPQHVYLRVHEGWETMALTSRSPKDLLSKAPSCQACALGATFVACALRFGEAFPMRGWRPYAAEMVQDLRGVFDPEELRLMEAAFESFSGFGMGVATFNGGVDDPFERMRRVMLAVVRAGGVIEPGTFGG